MVSDSDMAAGYVLNRYLRFGNYAKAAIESIRRSIYLVGILKFEGLIV